MSADGVWALAVLSTVAWGVFAFGAPYPWAYQPLAVAAFACGITGWLTAARPDRHLTAASLALSLIVLSVGLQLVPLPRSWMATLSPNAHQLLVAYDLSYATSPGSPHPLSIDPIRTVLALGLLVAFSVFVLGLARRLTRESLEIIVGGIALIAGIVALVGIIQHSTGTKKMYGLRAPIMGDAPFGPFVNKNHFAGWMTMALPVTASYLATRISRRLRRASLREAVLQVGSAAGTRTVLVALAVLAIAISVILTASRSGAIAGSVSLVTLIIAVSIRRSLRAGLIVAAVLVLTVVSGLIAVGPDRLFERFFFLSANAQAGRLPIWNDAFHVARDFWLTGSGLNTFGAATLFYQTTLSTVHVAEAHNDYLQLAAEGGLLVSVPVAIALAAVMTAARRRLQQSRGFTAWARLGAAAGLIGIAAQSMVEFSLQMPGIAVLFCVLLAITIAPVPSGTGAPAAEASR